MRGNKELFEKFSRRIEEVLHYLLVELDSELSKREYVGYHYWHIFTTAIRTFCQERLSGLMEYFQRELIVVLERNHETIFSEYPYRLQAVQFMKVMACDAYLLPDELYDRFSKLVTIGQASLEGSLVRDYDVVVVLASVRRSLGVRPNMLGLYESVSLSSSNFT